MKILQSGRDFLIKKIVPHLSSNQSVKIIDHLPVSRIQ